MFIHHHHHLLLLLAAWLSVYTLTVRGCSDGTMIIVGATYAEERGNPLDSGTPDGPANAGRLY